MSSHRLIHVSVAAGMLLLAGGCKGIMSNCKGPQAYASAEELPQLRIPVGLDGPDTRRALNIPPLDQPEVPRPPGARCLDEPPEFTPPARAAAEAIEAIEAERGEGAQRQPRRPPRPR